VGAWYSGPDPFNLGGDDDSGGSNDYSAGTDSSSLRNSGPSTVNFDSGGSSGEGDSSGAIQTSNWDRIAGGLDWAAGSTDEALGRQFDNQQGGGVADGLRDVTGATEYTNSQQFREANREYRNIENQGGVFGGVMANAKRFDVATRTGLDYVFDNPQASVQDTTRGGLEMLTGADGKEDFAQGIQSAAGSYSSFTRGALEGSVLDNPVTDGAVWAGEALVADPAKAAFTLGTGVDVDSEDADAEGTVGAVDAFDVGVTIGTSGLGGAGISAGRAALKGSDEGLGLADDFGGLASRFTGGSDEAANLASGGDDGGRLGSGIVSRFTRSGDEAAGGADDVAARSDVEGQTTFIDDAGTTSDDFDQFDADIFRVGDGAASESGGFVSRLLGGGDESGGLLSRFSRGSDEAATTTDDAATVVDDTAGASDDSVRASVEATESADESGGFLRNVLRGSDEGTQLADDGAEAAEESGSLLSRLIPGSTGGKLLAGGAAAVGGGALLESLGTFDNLQLTDPQTGQQFTMVRQKNYPQTETRPSGGVLWDVKDQSGRSSGYTTILRQEGRNVYILGADGTERRAQIPVETLQEAVRRRQGGAQ